MRSISTIFLGSFAALSMLTAPVLAKNSGAQTTDSEQTSPSCHAYGQNPDGTWKQLPCEELGSGSKSQPKSSGRSTDQAPH